MPVLFSPDLFPSSQIVSIATLFLLNLGSSPAQLRSPFATRASIASQFEGVVLPFFSRIHLPLLPSPPRRSVPVYRVLYSATMAAPPHTWSLVCAFLYFIQSLSRDPVNSSFLTKMRFVFVICLHMYIIQKCMTILYDSPGASVYPFSQRLTWRRVKII